MAITWRNVSAPDFTGASKMMDKGADRLSASLTGLQDIITKHQETQAANWDNAKTNNTNDVLASIMGAKSMEDYNALQSGLTKDALRGQYGAQIDLMKVLQANDSRDNDIRTDIKEGQDFTINQNTYNDRGTYNEALAMINGGEFGKARELIGSTQWNAKDSAANLMGLLTGAQRDKGRYDSTMATQASQRASAALNRKRLQDEMTQNAETRKHQQGLTAIMGELTANPDITERQAIEMFPSLAKQAGIPAHAVSSYLGSGKLDAGWDNVRGATEAEKLAHQQDLATIEDDRATDQTLLDNQRSLENLTNQYSKGVPDWFRNADANGDLGTVFDYQDKNHPLKQGMIWSTDEAYEDIHGDGDNGYKAIFGSLEKQATKLGVNDPGIVAAAMIQAISEVGRNDIDDSNKGEVITGDIKNRALSLLGDSVDYKKLTTKFAKESDVLGRAINASNKRYDQLKRNSDRRFQDPSWNGN
jgi:hypothetical protein